MAIPFAAILLGLVIDPMMQSQTEADRFEETVREYRREIQLHPRSFAAHYNLALLFLKMHKLNAGSQELERAAQLQPGNTDVHFNLGVVLLESKRPSEALSELRRARELQPDRPDVRFQTVRAYLALDRAGDARKEADEFAARNPDGGAAVGQLFLEAGQAADAAPYLQRAVESGLHADEARPLLADAWLRLKHPEKVLALVANRNTADDHFYRGQAMFDLGDMRGALAESTQAVEIEPANAKYLLFKARLHQRNGDSDAGTLLQQAVNADPGWFEPRYSLGVTLYFERNYDEAARELRQAARLNPKCARCCFLLGVVSLVQGSFREAEASFRYATALEPANSRFHAHLGDLLLRSGRMEESRRELNRAVALSPRYGLPHYELGKLLAQTSHLAEAARELEEAGRLDPELTQALYVLAQVDRKLGKPAAAEQVLARFREQKATRSDEQLLQDDLKPETRLNR